MEKEKAQRQQREAREKWQQNSSMEVDDVLLIPDEDQDLQLALQVFFSIDTIYLHAIQLSLQEETKSSPVRVVQQPKSPNQAKLEREMQKKQLQEQLRRIEEEERLERLKNEKPVKPLSPLEEERLLRIEQDKAFQESLQHDRQKEEEKRKQQHLAAQKVQDQVCTIDIVL